MSRRRSVTGSSFTPKGRLAFALGAEDPVGGQQVLLGCLGSRNVDLRDDPSIRNERPEMIDQSCVTKSRHCGTESFQQFAACPIQVPRRAYLPKAEETFMSLDQDFQGTSALKESLATN